MTTTQTQLRRGTITQVNAMTPVDGEPIYNTTDDRLHMGNGSTAGGIPHATFRDIQSETFVTATVGGTANAITLTLTPALAAYANGVRIRFKATANNTGATTVNVSGLGTRNIYKLSGTSLVALTGGEIVSGAWYELNDDGAQFQLGSGGAGASLTVVQQVFTSSGTYTPTSGMKYCIVEAVGGGGGGGGGSTSTAGGGGGGAGGYARSTYSAATIGASRTVTIGSAGTGGGIATNGNGGGTTSLGTLFSCTGGSGGGAAASGGGPGGGAGGSTSADINIDGGEGYYGGAGGGGQGGGGGNSFFGGGGGSTASTDDGRVGKAYGSGGGGGGASNRSGGAGKAGVMIITEYIG